MKRLFATIRCDVTLQWRNGCFLAGGFVVAIWALGLKLTASYAPFVRNLDWLLPALLLNELVIVTFFFAGGLVLLEKGEGSLRAQIVSPLCSHEYLYSKVITLTIAAMLQNSVIVILLPGIEVQWLPLVVGLILASVMFVLTGFVAAARVTSINDYLPPSLLYVSALLAPVAPYTIELDMWLFYLHPVQAPLVLLRAAVMPIAMWQVAYGILYSILWIVVLFRVSLRTFQHFVVARA